MAAQTSEPTIPESFLEHRQVYPSAWADRWTANNPFVGLLFPSLRPAGVELTDFSFNKDAANIGEVYLHIAVRKLNAAIRVGLDSVTYLAGNPDWKMAPQLVELFDGVSASLQKFVSEIPSSQKLSLTFHITPGSADFGKKLAELVNQQVLGDGTFYGISVYHENSSIVIDKSLRYEGAAFIRLQRTFEGALSFAEIAPQVYEDEVNTLKLLGITGVV